MKDPCCWIMEKFKKGKLQCTPQLTKEGYISACDDEFGPDSWHIPEEGQEDLDEALFLKDVPPVSFCPWCGNKQ